MKTLNTDNEITKALNKLGDDERNIITLFLLGKTYDEIGKTLGKKKQWIGEVIHRIILQHIYPIHEVRDICDNAFLFSEEEKKTNTNIYIDCTDLSKKYSLFYVKISRDVYSNDEITFRIVNKHYVTTEKNEKRWIAYLNELIKEDGLPIFLQSPKEGRIDRNTFLVKVSTVSGETVKWFFNKDKSKLMANPRVGFLYNACLYQIKKPKSIWDIYSEFKKEKETNALLTSEKINCAEDLSRMVYRKVPNIKKTDERCVAKLVIPKKISIFGFPIYEFPNVKITNDELTEKVQKIVEGETNA